VAIVPKDSSTSAPEADFGANDWLLEEMYERYITDPSSVDETWAEYFNSHGPPDTGAGDGAAKKQEPKPETAAEAPASRREPTPTTAAPAPAPAQASPAAQPPPAPAASRRSPTVEKPSPTKEIRPSAP
jgi:multifunctional 2-oxoglutarate metabolism enzyme